MSNTDGVGRLTDAIGISHCFLGCCADICPIVGIRGILTGAVGIGIAQIFRMLHRRAGTGGLASDVTIVPGIPALNTGGQGMAVLIDGGNRAIIDGIYTGAVGNAGGVGIARGIGSRTGDCAMVLHLIAAGAHSGRILTVAAIAGGCDFAVVFTVAAALNAHGTCRTIIVCRSHIAIVEAPLRITAIIVQTEGDGAAGIGFCGNVSPVDGAASGIISAGGTGIAAVGGGGDACVIFAMLTSANTAGFGLAGFTDCNDGAVVGAVITVHQTAGHGRGTAGIINGHGAVVMGIGSASRSGHFVQIAIGNIQRHRRMVLGIIRHPGTHDPSVAIVQRRADGAGYSAATGIVGAIAIGNAHDTIIIVPIARLYQADPAVIGRIPDLAGIERTNDAADIAAGGRGDGNIGLHRTSFDDAMAAAHQAADHQTGRRIGLLNGNAAGNVTIIDVRILAGAAYQQAGAIQVAAGKQLDGCVQVQIFDGTVHIVEQAAAAVHHAVHPGRQGVSPSIQDAFESAAAPYTDRLGRQCDVCAQRKMARVIGRDPTELLVRHDHRHIVRRFRGAGVLDFGHCLRLSPSGNDGQPRGGQQHAQAQDDG